MPATAISAQHRPGKAGAVVTGTGATEVACDAVNGNIVQNSNGRTLLVFRNSTAGALNVTFTTPNDEDGNAVADPVVSIPANGVRICGPFRTDVYGNPLTFTAASASIFVTAVTL